AHTMAYDSARGRTVLFGGSHGFVLGDLWEYHTVPAQPDAGTSDAGAPDAEAPDAEAPDAEAPDATIADAAMVDATSTDAHSLDAALNPSRDGGASAGDPDGGCGCRVVGTSASPSGAFACIMVLLLSRLRLRLRRPGLRPALPGHGLLPTFQRGGEPL